MCELYCKNGFKKDIYGCDICQCNPCPSIECSLACDYGLAHEDDGCSICACATSCPPGHDCGAISTRTEKILLGVLLALGCLVIISVLVVVFCVLRKKKRSYEVHTPADGFKNLAYISDYPVVTPQDKIPI
jgi:hypothetical protein